MFNTLYTAQAGLLTADARIGDIAHNLANLNIPGYRPFRLPPAAHASPQAAASTPSASDDLTPSEVNLAGELVALMHQSAAFRANLEVFRRGNSLVCTVLDAVK